MIDWPILPSSLKYKIKYEKFIESRRKRIIPDGQYYESHHIIPKCIGGTDAKTNLINLFPREHYIAHAMLWKMKFSGVYHAKMAYAFCTFIHGFNYKKHKGSYKFSSRLYEAFKRNLSKIQSQDQSGPGNNFYGKNHSEETKNKIRAYRKGKKLEEIFSQESVLNIREANKNKIITEEQKIKAKEGLKKYWANEENKQKKSLQYQKMWENPEYLEKMRPYIEARKGKPRDPEIIKKGLLSKKLKKEQGIPYFTNEALQNIRKAAKSRIISDMQREKIRLANKEKFAGKPKSEEHKRKIAEAVKKAKAEHIQRNGKYKAWNKGKPVSDAQKEKFRATVTAKKQSSIHLARKKDN